MTVYRYILLLTVLILWGVDSSYAQEPVLGEFGISNSDGTVTLSWTILAGATCNGIEIYHSTDTLNPQLIGKIYGVCGNITQPQSYAYTDPAPIPNHINYYWLKLGGFVFSNRIAIEIIDISHGGYQLRPNPVRSEARLYFDNHPRDSYQLTVYDMRGTVVAGMTTRDNHFDWSADDAPAGTYLFTITDPAHQVKTKGRLLVAH
jgi:hypothetical protein